MKIARVSLQRYDIPFVRPFVTAKFTLQNRQGLIIAAETNTGVVGTGEIAPLPGFSRETFDECVTSAMELIAMIRSEAVPESHQSLRFWSDEHFTAPPSVVFGFETMFADLAAQAAGLSLAHWYRGDANKQVEINSVIAGTLTESEIDSRRRQGYSTFKLKVGSLSIKDDISRVQVLREVIGTHAKIRLDANRAYQLPDALEMIQSAKPYKIEYIEEPLCNFTLGELSQLRRLSTIPIALDETLIEIYNSRTSPTATTFHDAAELDSFDVAIIKPSLMGGIAGTIAFCERLIRSGKRIVVTSALDSGIGVTAAQHIACALRLSDACGLDTTGALESHLVENPPAPLGGYLSLPNQSGLGVALTRDSHLRRYLTELHVD